MKLGVEVDYDISDDPNLNKHYITKNYAEMNTGEGGENTNDGEN